MKTTSALALLALGSAIALGSYVAGHVAISASNAFAGIGGVSACGLVLMALGDYARKPSFRVRRSIKILPPASNPAAPAGINAICDWTYTTISA